MNLKEDSQQEEDVFDLLPDALVLEIFNRVQDARSLSACMILCKRFGDLVPQTDNVCLTISRRNKLPESAKANLGNKLKGVIDRFIFKPIHIVHRMVARKPKPCSHCDDEDDNSFRLPNDMLKNFKEIRSLAVKLPGHDGDMSLENGSGALLKWKAEFGKELESCVVLGATGFRESAANQKNEDKENSKDDEITAAAAEAMPANLTNKQLKKRVVWMISCLIASSARHHMLKQIISLNQMIREVEISDGSKQGMIRMTERQVAELRKEMHSKTATAASVVEPEFEMERTKVPSVKIKMWYVPVLELPESGGVMKGATLAVIRRVVAAEENESSSAAVGKDDDVSLAMGAFGEKCLGEAVGKLIKRKKAYTLEMNSF